MLPATALRDARRRHRRAPHHARSPLRPAGLRDRHDDRLQPRRRQRHRALPHRDRRDLPGTADARRALRPGTDRAARRGPGHEGLPARHSGTRSPVRPELRPAEHALARSGTLPARAGALLAGAVVRGERAHAHGNREGRVGPEPAVQHREHRIRLPLGPRRLQYTRVPDRVPALLPAGLLAARPRSGPKVDTLRGVPRIRYPERDQLLVGRTVISIGGNHIVREQVERALRPLNAPNGGTGGNLPPPPKGVLKGTVC